MDLEAGIKKLSKDWKNALIPAILTYIPIVGLISTGYIIEAIKNYKKSLPKEIKYWELFKRGLGALGIAIIYSLIFGFAIGIVSLIGTIFKGLPAILLAAALDTLLGITFLLVMLAAIAVYAFEGFNSALNLAEIARLAFNFEFILSWIVPSILSSIITGIVAKILPVLSLPLGFYAALYTAYYIGEAYEKLSS